MKQPIRFSILGVGIAGRARARAIAADPRCRLVAVHRGRFADQIHAPSVDLDEAIHAADVVAVCSPSDRHPEQVERALLAGRHVVVEFPLAPTRAEAERLFAIARGRHRVLHVEHIERLDGPSVHLARHVVPAQVTAVDVSFSRRGPAEASRASMALGNVARLHRVVGVAGPFSHIERVEHAGGRLIADLRLESGAPVRARFTQASDASRHTVLEVHTPAGIWRQHDGALSHDGHPVPLASPPLFAADHEHLVRRLLEGAPPYVEDDLVVHVISVAEALADGRVGRVGP